jgi:hypothetical protein
MCSIIDANLFSALLRAEGNDEMGLFKKALFQGKAYLVYGGHLRVEYQRLERYRSILVEMDRKGIAKKVDDAAVDQETTRVRALRVCVSDDEHVIALARISGARLLCSNDAGLRVDFRNQKLVNRPRGNVYNRKSHAALMRRHCS